MQDSDLIEEARQGGLAGFTELVRRYQHRVRGYVAGLVGDRPEVIDDVAQETFLAAYRSIATYDATRVPFGAWLAGIARNRALTFLRGERRRRQREGDHLDELLVEARLHACEREEPDERRLGALAACLQDLPAAARSLIDARYRAEASVAELAQRSGRAQTAVRMALSRVRQLLRRCIEQRIAVP